jgi:hypothetical protein
MLPVKVTGWALAGPIQSLVQHDAAQQYSETAKAKALKVYIYFVGEHCAGIKVASSIFL